MRRLVFVLIAGLLVAATLVMARRLSPRPAPLLILIGIDGLRWDALDLHHPPMLSRLAAEGVRAERMIPSFPTLTFPNFYTLVTGLYPEHHGIVGNNMFDPAWGERFSLGSPAARDGRWWEGEPIWVTAQRQGVRTACMFWPGSEAEIGGVRPWQWRPFEKSVTPEQRVATLLGWLALPAAERPHLLTLYFHEVDTAAHRYGIDAPETAAAIQQVDAALAQLVTGLAGLDLTATANLIVVSDHGMASISPDRVIPLSALVDAAVPIDFSGAVAGLRPPPEQVESIHATLVARQDHFHVYRRAEIPERLHFRAHRRIPPLILIADEGWMLTKRPMLDAAERCSFLAATHGFDPELPSMGATFIASGPAFQRGVKVAPFENIHLYPLLCRLLGVRPAACDGDDRLAPLTLTPAAAHR